ncbi:pyocin knob domain-containing protein, partial [Flavobacterium sp.]|uniref:pyocin knob domain-containing protein n=1 Tax=Flavobacterium sp. TaxID=239 RepID=UPI0026189155
GLALKADTTYVNTGLAGKISAVEFEEGLADKASLSDLAVKANITDVNTKLADKANVTDLASKADRSDMLSRFDNVAAELDEKADLLNVDAKLATKASTTQLQDGLATKANATDLAAKANITDLNAGLALKADTTYVNNGLADKVSAVAFEDGLALKASKVDLNSGLAAKANATDLAAKANVTDLNAGLALKENITDVNTKLSGKANLADLAAKANIADVNTRFDETATVIQEGLVLKASKADLSAGLALKASASDMDIKFTEVTHLMTAKANADEVYGKINDLNAGLNGKANVADVNAGLAVKANTTDVNVKLSDLSGKLDAKANANEVYAQLGQKANTNEVDAKFGSMYEGLANKADAYRTLNLKGELRPGDDLNDYRQTGIFSQNSDEYAREGKNYPEFMAGMLTVIQNFTDEVMSYQTYYTYGMSNKVYNRSFYNGEWSPWNLLGGNGSGGGDYLLKSGNETKFGNLGIEGILAAKDKSENKSLRIETSKVDIPNIQGADYNLKNNRDISLQRQGGNVGIGTSSPKARLDVAGEGIFSGQVTAAPGTEPNHVLTLGQMNRAADDPNEKGFLKVLTFYFNPEGKYQDYDLINARIKYIMYFRSSDGKYFSPHILEPHNYEFYNKEGFVAFQMEEQSYAVVNYIK